MGKKDKYTKVDDFVDFLFTTHDMPGQSMEVTDKEDDPVVQILVMTTYELATWISDSLEEWKVAYYG